MVRNIVIEETSGKRLEDQIIEIVERKGTGHPDYMADSIAETFSRNLSRYYLDKFGSIMHHNVDKLEVIGGQTAPEYGGGIVLVPVSIMFSGRATGLVGSKEVPVNDIARDSAREFLKKNMRFVDPEDIRYLFETKPGSSSLSNVYDRKGILSNDTSFGAGYAPMTPTEIIVYDLERYMNTAVFKDHYPYSGEDVKILTTRKKKHLDIIVANAFVDKYIGSIDDYFDRKAELYSVLVSKITEMAGEELTFDLSINGMDDRAEGKNGCYLTVTGTSAEHGDDGSVGRGNRANGLITPNRTMSFEALAGKNPVNHIGKIYSILSFRMAEEIYSRAGIAVSVRIVGRIGDPVDEPRAIAITTSPGITADEQEEIRRIAAEMVGGINGITDDLVQGKIEVC